MSEPTRERSAIDRELEMLRQLAVAPRPPLLGCSRIAHERLGYCAGCSSALHPTPAALELNGWRLLALRDAAATPSAPPQ